jgi:F-type H+-transporting ATPase subunit epsilon
MADKTLYVEIVTPYSMFFEGPVEMVVVTGKDGEVGILPGEIRLKIDGQWKAAVATNGYAEIGPELTIIVVNAAEWPEQIDIRRAEKALARAEARLQDPTTSPQEKIRSRHGSARAKARIKVAKKYGHDALHR